MNRRVESKGQLRANLERFCLYMTKNRWDAEDVAQDAWAKALDKRVDGHPNMRAFLYRIAKNSWIDQKRRQRLANRHLELAKDDATSVRDIDTAHMELIFHALMKHMTPVQRAAFLLKDVYDYSLAEIAEMLEMTEGAVKAALHRARRSLDNVKRDLEREDLRVPEDAEYRDYLRELTEACVQDDVRTLVRLTLFGGGVGSASNKMYCMAA